MKPQGIRLLILGLLGCNLASADSPANSIEIPTPNGLTPCAPSDPVASAEARLAAKIGGVFVGCFQSEQKITLPGLANAAPTPVEYAFAVALRDRAYTPADLDKLLSTVKEQWKGFKSFSVDFKDRYIALVNELIKENGSIAPPTLVSVKPVLFSIDEADRSFYSVTSIRNYLFELGGERIFSTKVNAAAVALRTSQLIRLTIQRTLRDPADVTQVQAAITDWARATAHSSLPARP